MFKVGDRVKVSNETSDLYDRIGTVIQVTPHSILDIVVKIDGFEFTNPVAKLVAEVMKINGVPFGQEELEYA
jgi:hypothetical protein